jgi:hypothetical protein
VRCCQWCSVRLLSRYDAHSWPCVALHPALTYCLMQALVTHADMLPCSLRPCVAQYALPQLAARFGCGVRHAAAPACLPACLQCAPQDLLLPHGACCLTHSHTPSAPCCPQREYTHIREHARYRYLLHLDGASASYRLGLLMSTDSLVLRQRSPYVEYFTRCGGAGMHVVCALHCGHSLSSRPAWEMCLHATTGRNLRMAQCTLAWLVLVLLGSQLRVRAQLNPAHWL